MAWLTSPAQAAALRPRLTYQTSTVVVGAKGNGTLHVGLHVGGHNGDGRGLRVNVYPALRTRSALDQIISGAGSNEAPISSTGSFPLDCRTGGRVSFDIGVGHFMPNASGCATTSPVVTMQCADRCNGVYPISYVVDGAGGKTTLWSLVTVTSGVKKSLNVGWVLDATPTTSSEFTNGAKTLSALRHSKIVVNLGLSAPTLGAALLNGPSGSTQYLGTLSSFFAGSDNHVALALGPRNMDYGSLRARGLGLDVPHHFTTVNDLLALVHSGTTVQNVVQLPGVVGSASVAAVNHQGWHAVLLGEEALRTKPSQTLHWGTPFHVSGVANSGRALALDSPLSDLTNRRDIEPARLAALSTGLLSMLFYEAPNSQRARSVLVATDLNHTSPAFVKSFAENIGGSPLFHSRSVEAIGAAALIGQNRNPAVRGLTPAPTAKWRTAEISTLATLNDKARSLAATFSRPAPLLRIQLARLNAEVGLTNHGPGVVAAQRALSNELSKFRIDESTVIMAGSTSSIPVTIYSRADYSVTALLRVRADRITFANGNLYPVGLLTHTAALRLDATMNKGTSSLMDVALTTTDGKVVLARGTIQVRYAAASAVGYGLSAGSLLVIAWWWWRTYKKRRSPRHVS